MTTIRVDEELLTKTNDLGVNFFKIDENALKDTIKRIEGSDDKKESEDCLKGSQKTFHGGAGEIRTPVTSARGS